MVCAGIDNQAMPRFACAMTQPASNSAPDFAQLLANTVGAFRRRFGRPPVFAAVAPGRINIIGEHTDYSQGFALPMAIDRQTVIVADHAADASTSTLWAIDLDEVYHADFTRSLKPQGGHASDYVLGIAQQFIARGQQLPNLDLAVASTIPPGAGLSSSASVEVAFATLLEQVMHVRLSPLEKAMLCQQAEHDFPGTPCGIMDMYIISSAVPGHAMLLDCRSNQGQHVPLPPQSHAAILVIDTRKKHALASGEYAQRRAACERAAQILEVAALRDATIDMLNHNDLSNEDRRKVLHVLAENSRTILAATALASGDLEQLGELMFASHDSLRDLFEVSCDELDILVDAARELRGDKGVYGARMTGGGFGGCVIAICRTEQLRSVQQHLAAAFEQAFGRPCGMFTTTASGAARTVDLARDE